MNQNYPQREATVVRRHELRVTRRFPFDTEIKARINQRVAADEVIGQIEPHLVATRLPIADQLDISPSDLPKHLMKRAPGTAITAGEPLARMRKGMRSVVVASPVTGTLIAIELDTGIALIAPAGAGEMRALLPGDIEYIDGKRSIILRTVGSRLTGIIGLGAPVSGKIRILHGDRLRIIQPDDIPGDMAGAIAVSGGPVGAAALRHLVDNGAVGLVTGGILERDTGSAFGWLAEDRLSAWRPQPGDRGIGEGLPMPLSLMATEGFGAMPMNEQAFALLQELDRREAVLIPTTRVIGTLTRPELIVPEPTLLDEDGDTSHAALTPGTYVRLTDHAHLGQPATVIAEPHRATFPNGSQADGVTVELAGGKHYLARIVNVEVVALA